MSKCKVCKNTCHYDELVKALKENNIDCIYNWSPTAPQWWITGFNPEYVGKVDVTKYVMIGTVDFSGREEMYKSLKYKYEKNNPLSPYVYFDKDASVMWLCWYEGDSIK